MNQSNLRTAAAESKLGSWQEPARPSCRWSPRRQHAARFGFAVLVSLWSCAFIGLKAADAQTLDRSRSTSPSESQVQQRMDSVRNSSTTDAATKTALLEQYSKVIAALGMASEHRQAADDYEHALQAAIPEAEAVRRQIAESDANPLASLTVTATSSSQAIEGELERAKTDESTSSLTMRQLDGRIAEQDSRQQAIRSRQVKVREEIAPSNMDSVGLYIGAILIIFCDGYCP